MMYKSVMLVIWTLVEWMSDWRTEWLREWWEGHREKAKGTVDQVTDRMNGDRKNQMNERMSSSFSYTFTSPEDGWMLRERERERERMRKKEKEKIELPTFPCVISLLEAFCESLVYEKRWRKKKRSLYLVWIANALDSLVKLVPVTAMAARVLQLTFDSMYHWLCLVFRLHVQWE